MRKMIIVQILTAYVKHGAENAMGSLIIKFLSHFHFKSSYRIYNMGIINFGGKDKFIFYPVNRICPKLPFNLTHSLIYFYLGSFASRPQTFLARLLDFQKYLSPDTGTELDSIKRGRSPPLSS
jgi:hypothetical protein